MIEIFLGEFYEKLKRLESSVLRIAQFPSVPLYNPSLRVVQTNPKKIYAIDPGLVRASTLEYEGELGRLFENVVYLDLRRRGYQISYYLTAERMPVDFLIQFPRGDKKLLQVAWDMENPQTAEREQRALKVGMDELGVDGSIVTLDSYLRQGVLTGKS